MSTAIPPPREDGHAAATGATGGVRTSADPGHSLDRRDVVARQKERFGGMKFGSSFFGWLTATGTAVLLTAIVAAISAQVGASQNVDANTVSTRGLASTGVVGGIVLLVIILVAYFSGGYVAGRMARFNGLKQGLAVWLWAIIITVVLGVITMIAGSKFDIMSRLNALPDIGLSRGSITTAGVLAAVAVAVVSLVGAILGGLAGMRFHRRVDKFGLDG